MNYENSQKSFVKGTSVIIPKKDMDITEKLKWFYLSFKFGGTD